MKAFFDIVSNIGHSASPPAAVTGAAPQAAPGAPAAPTSGQEFTVGQTVDRDGMQITAGPLRKVKPQYGDQMVSVTGGSARCSTASTCAELRRRRVS
jgi:hypothetical protein